MSEPPTTQDLQGLVEELRAMISRANVTAGLPEDDEYDGPIGREFIKARHKVSMLLDHLVRLGAENERLKRLHVSFDGPYTINEQRGWLARKLLDSKLSDDEAFGVVAYHPDITDAYKTKDPSNGR